MHISCTFNCEANAAQLHAFNGLPALDHAKACGLCWSGHSQCKSVAGCKFTGCTFNNLALTKHPLEIQCNPCSFKLEPCEGSYLSYGNCLPMPP
eukprot:1159815-Pelagomonas_calceolata.AAC.14